MSIIEKALDKALGRTEEETAELPEHVIAPEPEEAVAPAAPEAPPELATRTAEPIAPPERLSEQSLPTEQDPIAELPIEGPVHALDWESLKTHGFVVEKEDGLAETYREIGRPVLANAFPGRRAGIQRGNLVLVTSSRAGEGKTFTALNLALSLVMGDPDLKVLLVDADTEKASLSRMLGLAEQAGLSELIESKNQRLQDFTCRTDLAGLRILPAGQSKQKGHGLLASSPIMKFAKELAKGHPALLVIFDGPPLLDAAETPSLAMQVGQVLVVVEVEMTPQVVLREAVAKLEFCNVVGCILNKATQSEREDTKPLAFGYGLYQPELSES